MQDDTQGSTPEPRGPGAAIAAYRRQTGVPAVDVLLCDDAPQFKLLAVHLRHPEVPSHNNACELEARVAARRRDVSVSGGSSVSTRPARPLNGAVGVTG